MRVLTMASVGGAAVAMSPVSAIQGVFGAVRAAMLLVRRAVAAAMVPAGLVPVALGSLVLPSLPVFSRADFLEGGAVAVFGMVLLAGAISVAARLLFAPG